MIKLIIQIPCYNEEKTLAKTIYDLPIAIDGVDCIEYVVIVDGCTDNTESVARACGVHHIIILTRNGGLARAFMSGIDYAIKQKANIIVNTDGDNQYRGVDIEKLIAPILQGKADMVIGARPIIKHPEFGIIKKILQKLGSFVLRCLSGVNIQDATSGFRAYSVETAMRLHLHSTFSHCIESLIQVEYLGLRVLSVDIGINPKTRESRLFKNVFQYVWKQTKTMLSMFVLYRPFVFFFWLGLLFIIPAILLGLHFIDMIYIHPKNLQRNMTPSLILAAVFSLCGFMSWSLGLIGSLVKSQRRLTEEQLYLMKKDRYG